MIIFSTPSRGQQVLSPLGPAQTTSLLVVLIAPRNYLLGRRSEKGAPDDEDIGPLMFHGVSWLAANGTGFNGVQL